jgi:hypothetical protein
MDVRRLFFDFLIFGILAGRNTLPPQRMGPAGLAAIVRPPLSGQRCQASRVGPGAAAQQMWWIEL